MKPLVEMTRAELTAYIQSHLREKGVDAVLSGGSAVSIYNGEQYVSMDLDLVNVSYTGKPKIRDVMSAIGCVLSLGRPPGPGASADGGQETKH